MTSSKIIAGVDEAGRGPLFGPVVAAAVILDPNAPIEGLADSKKLTEKKREALFDVIKARALSYGIALASAQEIDEINILQASLLAMARAVSKLDVRPDLVLVDGNCVPKLDIRAEAIVKGDQKIAEISAASILAKVARDRMILEADVRYPGYDLAKHKGYPTKAHIESLKRLGPTDQHRKTFGPVRAVLVVESI